MSAETSTSSNGLATSRPVTVRVRAGAGPDAARYRMFDLEEVSGEGAFLAGPVLFEKGEEFEVELELAGGPTLVVRARVIELAQSGHDSGMQVCFLALDDEQRKLLNDTHPAAATGA